MDIECEVNDLFEKKISECSFDSFDLDDGYLFKIAAETKNKDKTNIKVPAEILNDSHQCENNEVSKKNNKSSNFRILQNSSEADSLNFNSKNPKTFTSCISPIHGSLPTKDTKNEFSSSTPVRKNLLGVGQNQVFGKELQEYKCDYSEADLFEDWGNKNFYIPNNFEKTEEDLITLSQAVQIIEKESTKESESEMQDLNLSINLLTGENIQNSNNCLTNKSESFKKSAKMPLKEHIECNKSLNLNFLTEEVPKKFLDENIYFSSDDDNVFNQVYLTSKSYNKSLSMKKKKFANLNSSSSDESFYLKKNRKKGINIIESDSPEKSMTPNFHKKKKPIKRKDFQGKQYIVSEAEVNEEVSSDETERDSEEYDKSFLDENSYYTQNASANMTAKYLESTKNVFGSGNFKIVKCTSYDPINVFSQFSEEENTDYEIDSFCVTDFDDEVKTDLSDLEIVEKILEIDKKKKKRKRTLRKFKKK